MIINEQHLNFMRAVASGLSTPMLLNDYGEIGVKAYLQISAFLFDAYKYISLHEYKKIVVCKSLQESCLFEDLNVKNFFKISDYSILSATNQSDTIYIEIINESEAYITYEGQLIIDHIRSNAVVYHYKNGQEIVYGVTSDCPLPKPAIGDSFFCLPTYKNLESALEGYRIQRARHSKCNYLQEAWFDDKRIYFKKGYGSPEALLRRSLYEYLFVCLRDADVQQEQNVNETEPVDIKVIWKLAHHIAIIEIKWLGRAVSSYNPKEKPYGYDESRARDGALQLSNYLNSLAYYSVGKNTRGYLVVFDGRRKKINKITTSISREEGLHFQNKEIAYDPEYEKTRTDFAKPVRFFLEPSI